MNMSKHVDDSGNSATYGKLRYYQDGKRITREAYQARVERAILEGTYSCSQTEKTKTGWRFRCCV